MSQLIIPSEGALEAWDTGESISDDQLSVLTNFFRAMVRGCEVLGTRYSLATMALRMELDRAERIESYRRSRSC
jgi:hypothetical protein